MSDTAVRLLVPEHPDIARTVRSKIMRRRAELVDMLVNAQSWEDYKQRQGHIRGLDEAIRLCEEAEKELN